MPRTTIATLVFFILCLSQVAYGVPPPGPESGPTQPGSDPQNEAIVSAGIVFSGSDGKVLSSTSPPWTFLLGASSPSISYMYTDGSRQTIGYRIRIGMDPLEAPNAFELRVKKGKFMVIVDSRSKEIDWTANEARDYYFSKPQDGSLFQLVFKKEKYDEVPAPTTKITLTEVRILE